jgi:hypothetical protein
MGGGRGKVRVLIEYPRISIIITLNPLGDARFSAHVACTASGRIIVENRDNDHAENRAILQRHISAIILPEAVAAS